MRRVLRAVAIVAALGAVAGALVGLVGALVFAFVASGSLPDVRDTGSLLALGAATGVAFGAVLAPLISFVLLPRVPLGRAILVTSAGTLAGIVTAILADQMMNLFNLAVAGFVIAAVLLRIFSSRKATAPRDRMGA